MNRLALGCRPNARFDILFDRALANGIRTFDTIFQPQVATELKKRSNEQNKVRVLLKTLARRKEDIEFEVRTFLASGSGIDLVLLSLEPDFAGVRISNSLSSSLTIT
jgi:hypothetical protein